MRPGQFYCHLSTQLAASPGFLFSAAFALALVSCEKKVGTPAWDPANDHLIATTESAETSPPPPSAKPRKATHPANAETAASATKGNFRFIAYNVENWLTEDRPVDLKPLKNPTKPATSKSAVIRILTNNSPDVVGLCEIGGRSDLAEIQQSLKAAGLDLPHSHYTEGTDPVRHLALLSRFPISTPAKPAATEFQMKGQTFAINRGILDATVSAPNKSYRLLGVHLKSKREIEGIDQEEMRINEARLLRRHVDAILLTDPVARLVVYGDFNDSRPSKAFQIAIGNYNDPGYLTAIPLKDSRGEAWTHYWALHDIYSRFDFITLSRALKPDLDFRASIIIDDPSWIKASDHRPLLAVFVN